jgi:hypothetical protein
MSKIPVALWSYDSHGHYGIPESGITNALQMRLKNLNATLPGLADRRMTDLQAIFVAPEYLYVAARGSSPGALYGRRFPMTSAEKDVVERALLGLSREFPKILIIPGTVFYQEEVVGEARHRMRDNLLANEMELKKAYVKILRPAESLSMVQIAKVDIRNDLATGRVNVATLSPAKRGQLRDFLDNMESWEQRGIRVPGLLELAKAFRKRDEFDPLSKPLCRARNCAYLFLGGQRVGTYDKHSDFQETSGAKPDKLAFVPGTADQAPEVDGLRFAVEICFDHGNGVLKGRGLGDLDFHVVVSDSVKNSEGNMAMKRGGYFLHASSDPSQTAVKFRESNGSLKSIELHPKPRGDAVSVCTIDSPS